MHSCDAIKGKILTKQCPGMHTSTMHNAQQLAVQLHQSDQHFQDLQTEAKGWRQPPEACITAESAAWMPKPSAAPSLECCWSGCPY